MRWGIVKLFCPICGKQIDYDQNKTGYYWSHDTFGLMDSRECFDKAQLKWARMILGKDDE